MRGRRASASSSVWRRSSFCGGSVMSTFGGAGCFEIGPKYFSIFASVVFVSTSPTIASTALFGA